MDRKISPLLVAALVLSGFSACSSHEKRVAHSRYDRGYSEEKIPPVARAQPKVATVDFKRGAASLSAAEKKELRSLIRTAEKRGKIEEVRVLAWADRETLKNKRQASPEEVTLAEQRAKAVRKYLKEQLEVPAVSTFNMAQEPGPFAKLFRTEDYQIKTGDYGTKPLGYRPPSSPRKAVVVIKVASSKTTAQAAK